MSLSNYTLSITSFWKLYFDSFLKTDNYKHTVALSHLMMKRNWSRVGIDIAIPDVIPDQPLILLLMKAIGFHTNDKTVYTLKKEMHLMKTKKSERFFDVVKPSMNTKDELKIDCEIILLLTGYYEKYQAYSEENLQSYFQTTKNNIYWYICPHDPEVVMFGILGTFMKWCSITYGCPRFLPVYIAEEHTYCLSHGKAIIDVFREYYTY